MTKSRSLVRGTIARRGAASLLLLVTAGACADVASEDEDLGSVAAPLCSGTSVTGNPAGIADQGATVTLTAQGGSCASGETPEYRFVFKRDGTSDAYTSIRGYGTSPSVAWNTTGLPSGKYQVVVYTRSVGSTAAYQHIAYYSHLIRNVCTSGALTASPPGPQAAGVLVTLTGTGSCTGSASPEFHYYYRRSGQTSYTEIAPYSSSPVVWNTSALEGGTYSLVVYTRAVGNASTYEAMSYGTYQIGSACSSVVLSASPAAPQQPGTPVLLTGSANCGGQPAEYRFFYRAAFDTGYHEIQAYGANPTATWSTTGLGGGAYTLLVQARVAGNFSAAEANGYAAYKLGFTAQSLIAGPNHTCVLLDTGLKCFGRNLLGAPTGQYSYDRGLEAADMGDNLPVVSLGTGRKVKALARGAYHACALLDNGALKCWGANSEGALGLGDFNHRSAGAAELGNSLPGVNLGTGRTAVAITAGLGFSCALLDNGSVKCWGANTYGSLGLGDLVSRGDEPSEMGDSLPVVSLGTGRTATKIEAGVGHVCAILDDASLKCWGLNNFGQLGVGDHNSRGDAAGEMGDALPVVNLGTGRTAKHVALGVYHTCAILDNDSLKCWGQGTEGAIGLGDTVARGDGANEMGDALPIVNVGAGRLVKGVTAGGAFTCALLDNDALKCWGRNTQGQLGLGDTASRGDNAGEMGDVLAPVNLGSGRFARKVTAGYINTCAELDTGAIKCWGASVTGMLGIGPSERRGDSAGDMGDALPGFSLGASAPVASFGSGLGYHYGCALLTNETVKCWGSNSFGQLGIDRSSHTGDEPDDTGARLSYVSLGTGAKPVAAAGGEYHSCALLDDGRAKCWGANLYGTSGLGDTQRHDGRASYLGDNLGAIDFGPGRTAKRIYSGADFACAILDNDSVKCWGENSNGQLGVGDRNDRGDGAGEMGTALPVVALGSGRIATSLSLGYRHACAVLDNGDLKCWGWNGQGQLGLGQTADRGDAAGEMGDALPRVNLGTGRTARAVFAGYFNTCAILDNSAVKCWGNNQYGQLGVGDTLLRGTLSSAMGDNLPAVNLGSGRTATSLGLGIAHACALLDNQRVKCWGYNAHGKLGYGDLANRGDAPGEMGDTLAAVDFGSGANVTSLAVGWNHNCVLIAGGAGSVRCWGKNDEGALGLGDNVTRGDGVGEMGTFLGAVNLGSP
jgi:alpha-tubulin suppressor-like RCC1 family protein